MTTIVSIDELNTATEMPRQVENPQMKPENQQAFDEAVSRFQTALGGEGLKLDAESLGLGDAATGKMPVAPESGKMPVAPESGVALESGKMPVALESDDSAISPEVKSGRAVAPRPLRSARGADPTCGNQGFDVDYPDQPEAPVVLQSAPMMTVPLDSTAVQQQVSDTIKVTSVESAAALRSQMLVSAVEEVCEAIQVSPGVQPGQGEVRIQLKADVLSGTVVFLEAKGTTITVAFNPATADVAEVLSRNITQFEQHLAGRVHNYQISARVRKLKG